MKKPKGSTSPSGGGAGELEDLLRKYFNGTTTSEGGRGVLAAFPRDVQRIIWRRVIIEENWSAAKAEQMAAGTAPQANIEEIKAIQKRCAELKELTKNGGRKKTDAERHQDDLRVAVAQQNLLASAPRARQELAEAYQIRAQDTVFYTDMNIIVDLLKQVQECESKLAVAKEFYAHPDVMRQASAGLADLSWVLAHDDSLWERWWYQDFARFEHDLHIHANGLPEWILQSPNGGLDGPWKRFYAWCKLFERRCAKLIATMTSSTAEGYYNDWEDAPNHVIGPPGIFDSGSPEYTLHTEVITNYTVEYNYRRINKKEVVPIWQAAVNTRFVGITEVVRQSGTPWMAWIQICFHDLNEDVMRWLSTDDLEEHSLDEDPYVSPYNYASTTNESSEIHLHFILWYASETLKYLGDKKKSILDDYLTPGAGPVRIYHYNEDRDDPELDPMQHVTNKDDPWKLLRNLPSAPRRNGIRFAGACIACNTAPLELFHCGNCQQVQYCSEQCQESHWDAKHKDECQ